MSVNELYADYGTTFFPFHLRGDATQPARHSIGGLPPSGIIPEHATAHTTYFATLGLTHDLDVSLFNSFDYEDKENPNNFFEAAYRLWPHRSDLMQFIVHRRQTDIAASSRYESHLPYLGFFFEAASSDPVGFGAVPYATLDIYSDHKAGGIPYFEQLEGSILDDSLSALSNGYIHMLQLAFPGPQDSPIDADWPFGFMIFHLFAKRVSDDGFDFLYGWA